MEEPDRVRVAAVLAADAEPEVRPHGAAALDRHPHQLADSLLVDRAERRPLDDPDVLVVRDDAGFDVVAREAERRLREVVGAEREELGVARDVAGGEARAGQLDHRPDAEAVSRAKPSSTATRMTRSRASSSSRA